MSADATSTSHPAPIKLSPVEKIKQASDFLKGTIDQELVAEVDHFDKSNIQLLKFFGTYQQDDRDARLAAKKTGGGRAFSMMVRLRIPGGRITASQFTSMLDMCEELGNSTMKITTRQTIQLHGILKSDLKETIRRIDEMALSTLAACGDVNRNIMCCPAKRVGGIHQELNRLTDELTAALEPKTWAYHDLFLLDENGEKTAVGGSAKPPRRDLPQEEPLYGPTYLPRKFKMGLALPEDNCIDIYTQDIGLLAIVRDGKIAGYDVIVGGGMGRTPSAAKTFPALGKKMAFVTPDQVVRVCQEILKVQRDNGDRSDRKVARMKYLVARWGIERFRTEVEAYYGEKLADPTDIAVTDVDDHMGWQDQGDGLWSYGLNIENGRLYDNDKVQFKALMRALCARFGTEIRMTGHQSVIFTDIDEADKDELISIVRQHGVRTSEETSTARRWSMACVALPTCGLAITESERRLPGIIDSLEAPLAKLGLAKERFTIRMTGCPNGCARPYNADMALVGKAKDKYTLFVGGGWLGDHLAFIYKDLVPDKEIVGEMVRLFSAFRVGREEGESFGAFCRRVGRDDLEVLADAAPQVTA
ncbi:MAG: NADPH-dependent assimilatory sulfite reductase hemoprotein subunit [Planctomycetota bacterium]